MDSETSVSRPTSLCTIPEELRITILKYLNPSDVISARLVCKSLSQTSLSLSLWSHLAQCMESRFPLCPSLTVRDPTGKIGSPGQTEDERRQEIEWCLISGEKLDARWSSVGSEPRTVFKTRAHIDRITCMKLVLGSLERVEVTGDQGGLRLRRKRWLITGAVDGYVRVWDLSGPLPDVREQHPKGSNEDNPLDPLDISVTTGAAGAGVELLPGSFLGNGRNVSDARRKKRNSILLAEVDSGGDVTAIDAEMGCDGRTINVAVGSYYSSAGCLVYVLDLCSRPAMLDCRGSLNPPHWCGTQCVSIRGEKVAVGTYTGLLHVFDWKSGWRAGIERSDRSATASVKLFPRHIVTVTRLGIVELFSLPEEQNRRIEEAVHRSPVHGTADDPMSNSASTIPGRRLSHYALSEVSTPIVNASFGDSRFSRERELASSELPSLSLFSADVSGVSHFVFHTLKEEEGEELGGFPYSWPPKMVSRQSLASERMLGAAIGMTGRRGVVLTSLGGVPPACCVRAYSSPKSFTASTDWGTDEPSCIHGPALHDGEMAPQLHAMRPTPNVSLPRTSLDAPSRSPNTFLFGPSSSPSSFFPRHYGTDFSPGSTSSSARSSFSLSATVETVSSSHGMLNAVNPQSSEGPRSSFRLESPLVGLAGNVGESGGASPSISGALPSVVPTSRSIPIPTRSNATLIPPPPPSPSLELNASDRDSRSFGSSSAPNHVHHANQHGVGTIQITNNSSSISGSISSSSTTSSVNGIPPQTEALLPAGRIQTVLPPSSATTAASSSSFGTGPPSRADVLTEAVIEESSGLVCLATARGMVWVADYSEPPAPPSKSSSSSSQMLSVKIQPKGKATSRHP
ncbi:hypothetical protein IE53DRAFT_380782 [Violaceomyces palustris]|uniref:Uncharacterized protein n=1 Tax=Violaceomyces palustris TaxID=1673888 RepID=A0ACD0NTM7_9BASI|nr:hypothetical protein IE53DRAFT_380782 [Violaceomyces palustris]